MHILQSLSPKNTKSCGCVLTGLDCSKRVCHRADWQMPAKTSKPGGVLSIVISSSNEIPTVVPVTGRVMHSQSSPSTTISRPFDTPGVNASVDSAATSRMATISQSYSDAGISQGAQKLLVAAWRKGVPPLHAPQLGENGIASAVNGTFIQFLHQWSLY